MKRQFNTRVAILLAAFAVGAFYGALWDRCGAEAPSATSPASIEEIARYKADLNRLAPAPIKDHVITNAASNSPS